MGIRTPFFCSSNSFHIHLVWVVIVLCLLPPLVLLDAILSLSKSGGMLQPIVVYPPDIVNTSPESAPTVVKYSPILFGIVYFDPVRYPIPKMGVVPPNNSGTVRKVRTVIVLFGMVPLILTSDLPGCSHHSR